MDDNSDLSFERCLYIYIEQGVQIQDKRSRLRSFRSRFGTVLFWTVYSRYNRYWHNGAGILRKLEIGASHVSRACKRHFAADRAYVAVYLHIIKIWR